MTNRYWDRAISALCWKLSQAGIQYHRIYAAVPEVQFNKGDKQYRVVVTNQKNDRTGKLYIHLYRPDRNGNIVRYTISSRRKLFRECGMEYPTKMFESIWW